MNIFEKAIMKLEQMRIDEKGDMSPNAIIGLAISVIVMAAVLPSALTSLFNTSTAGWSTGAVALWTALPLVIIAAVVVAYYSRKQ
jgi:hypothetical protein